MTGSGWHRRAWSRYCRAAGQIEGADHSLAFTHPREVADAVASFLDNHPLSRDTT